MNYKYLETIKLGATSGKKTLARADDIFTSYLDSDFKNWGTDKTSNETSETRLALCELTENSTYKQIFTNPDAMCLTQHQIIDFVANNKDKLNKSWYIFFLFKVDSKYFVAYVYFDSHEQLEARVYEFSNDDVWDAEYQDRFVIPQLALNTSDTSSSDSVTLSAIEVVKKAGYEVYKRV